MPPKKVGEVYRCIHTWIVHKADKNYFKDEMILDKEDLTYLLGVVFHIPKEKKNTIIKELIDYGMIVQVNRGRAGIKYRILG